jgi:hypothetical protein
VRDLGCFINVCRFRFLRRPFQFIIHKSRCQLMIRAS